MRPGNPLVGECALEVNHWHLGVWCKAVSISSNSEQPHGLVRGVCEGCGDACTPVVFNIVARQSNQSVPGCADNSVWAGVLGQIKVLQLLKFVGVADVQQTDLRYSNKGSSNELANDLVIVGPSLGNIPLSGSCLHIVCQAPGLPEACWNSSSCTAPSAVNPFPSAHWHPAQH